MCLCCCVEKKGRTEKYCNLATIHFMPELEFAKLWDFDRHLR